MAKKTKGVNATSTSPTIKSSYDKMFNNPSSDPDFGSGMRSSPMSEFAGALPNSGISSGYITRENDGGEITSDEEIDKIKKKGFYGSMSALEEASTRLADAAMKRESELLTQKGTQETELQKLRGEQEKSLQAMRGEQALSFERSKAEQEARSLGYASPEMMAYDVGRRREDEDRKMREEEYAQQMRDQGYTLVGGRWLRLAK